MGLIGAQPDVYWQQQTGRTLDEAGEWVPEYAPPMQVKGSLQPLSAARYQQLGLDLARRYFSFFTSASIQGVGRDSSGDLLDIAARRYQAESLVDGDWSDVDGWREVIVVDIGPTP
ncbi:hypothetical protein ACFSVK_06305 [Azorhizophilus paspali]